MEDRYNDIRKEIEALEEAMDKAWKTPEGIREFLGKHYCADTIDIHGSGWSYTPEESIQMACTQATYELLPDVIHSAQKNEHIKVLSESFVIVVRFHEIYFAVPNPQDLARKAGTLTMDINALSANRSDQKEPLGPGPGEMLWPNPYRARTTRIWMKMEGNWKLVLSQRTWVGKRGRPLLRAPADLSTM